MKITLAAGLSVLQIGCASFGAKVDDQCIAGRLSEEAAAELNERDEFWAKRHKDYTADIEEGDRVLSRDCSEFLLSVQDKDFDGAVDARVRMRANDD